MRTKTEKKTALGNAPRTLQEAQQQARLNEQVRLQGYEVENRRRAAIVTALASEIRAAGFTIKNHSVTAIRFGTAECPDMYFGTFAEGDCARIGINSFGAEAIAKGTPKAAVRKLLLVIASE